MVFDYVFDGFINGMITIYAGIKIY